MNEKMNYRIILQEELKHFGLNPREWKLLNFDSGSFLIQNILDQSFTLKGQMKLKKKQPHWKTIEVHSL